MTDQSNHALTEYSNTGAGSPDPDASPDATEPTTATDDTVDDGDGVDAFEAGDVVTGDELPSWTTWDTKAVEVEGLVAIPPKPGDSHLIKPVENCTIPFEELFYLPNFDSATDARLASDYPSLQSLRDSIPTSYAEFSDDQYGSDDEAPFDPVVVGRSIHYDGYSVVDETVLERAYRITQGKGRIDPSATRVTPLSARYTLIEALGDEQHAYLHANQPRSVHNSAAKQQNYKPEVQNVAGLRIPDDEAGVAEQVGDLLPHLNELLDIQLAEHTAVNSCSHVFATADGEEVKIKAKSLKNLAAIETLDDLDSIVGEQKFDLHPIGTATIELEASDFEKGYGEWLRDGMQNQKVFGVTVRVKAGGSIYGRSSDRNVEAGYYTLTKREHEGKPDEIKVRNGTSKQICEIDYSDITYSDD